MRHTPAQCEKAPTLNRVLQRQYVKRQIRYLSDTKRAVVDKTPRPQILLKYKYQKMN
jgi:hypothetical protein